MERGVRDFAQTRTDFADTGTPDAGELSGRRTAPWRRARQDSIPPQAPNGSRQRRRYRRYSIFGVVRRMWVVLVILAVVIAGGFTVSRLHGIFGSEKRLSYGDTRVDDSKPFNPKHLRYEVFGASGSVADISYFDGDGEPRRLKKAPLPWSLEFEIGATTAVGNVMAQGDGDTIGCRILVDNVVKSEKTTHETNAFTFCLLKAA
jgi:Mycobacterium membrane protein